MISSNQPITKAALETVRAIGSSDQHDHDEPQHDNGNVGQMERTVSIVAGATLGLLALSKPVSLRGLLFGAAAAGLLKRGVSGNCQLYGKLGINTNVEPSKDPHAASARPAQYFNRGIHVEQSVSINKPAKELYAYWRNFENLPRVMSHLNSVAVTDDKRSHWSAKAPLGYSVEWDAEIINDEPDKLIAWRSVGDATVDNSGSVRFIERGNGMTDVRVVLEYIPPAGKLGALVARLFGESPDIQVRDDLRRFKQLMSNS